MSLIKLVFSLLLALVALDAYSMGETECIKDLSPGVRKTYYCKGQSYNLSVSEKCAEEGGCGLIIDVHGLTMDAYQQDQTRAFRCLDQRMISLLCNPSPHKEAGMKATTLMSTISLGRLEKLLMWMRIDSI